MISPWMATPNAFEPKPRSFERPPFLNGANHVMRAGRLIPAIASEQRTKYDLIDAYQ